MTLLCKQLRHGYELKLELDRLLGLKGKINPGQIYTTIDRLIRDGLVSAEEQDEQERKKYRLTAQGRQALEEWLLETVPYHEMKEDFFFKWNCARDIGYDKEQEMLNQQKRAILTEVMDLTQQKTDHLINGEETEYLLISGKLLHLEADLNWMLKSKIGVNPNKKDVAYSPHLFFHSSFSSSSSSARVAPSDSIPK